ncbi:MAG: alpha/beta hydrolase [Robiginitomaculum sp.]|nr:alpha/beta hydrolase [Robiginitomaculum sp.]
MSNNSHYKIVQSRIELNGHTLITEHPVNLSERGGTVWLFLHGIAVTPSFWAPLMPQTFLKQEPWISVSLPVHSPSSGPQGFSRTDVKPDLFNTLNTAVLDKLLPGRDVVIVGHSTGGFAGLCLAHACPDRVRGAISVGGFADGKWSGLEGDMQLMARKEKLGAFGPFVLRISSWLTTRWPWLHEKTASAFAYDRKAFFADKPSKNAFRMMRRDARSQNQSQLIEFFAGIRDVDIWNIIPQIEQPVLVFAGEHDPVIPHEQTIRLNDTLPNSQLLVYADVGHMIMNERREAFWKDIALWKKSLLSKSKP